MSDGSGFRVGFLGAGKMATALAHGWISSGLAERDRTLASDPLPKARDAFTAATGARSTADNREVVTSSDVLILAVKPQSMAALLSEVRPAVSARHLIISI